MANPRDTVNSRQVADMSALLSHIQCPPRPRLLIQGPAAKHTAQLRICPSALTLGITKLLIHISSSKPQPPPCSPTTTTKKSPISSVANKALKKKSLPQTTVLSFSST